MRFASQISLVCALLSVALIPALGQDNPPPPTAAVAPPGNCPFYGRAIPAAPYSAHETTEVLQTLADGTRIEHKRQSRQIYRDSQGRIREDHYSVQGPAGTEQNKLTGITITDAVECVRYVLNVRDLTATRIRFPLAGIRQGSPATPDGAALVNQPRPAMPPPELRPKTTSEPLGTQTLEGIVVQGLRMTTIFPPGSADNDRQIVQTSEVWTAPDLHIVLLRTIDDPRSGLRTIRLTNIDRSEPDAALFRVPPDYTIVSRE